MSNETVVIWDVETTELIDRQKNEIANMEISVACAIVLDLKTLIKDPRVALDEAQSRSFWHESVVDKVKDGEHLFDLVNLLVGCHVHVAFNGIKFDMQVMKKHFSSMHDYNQTLRKLYDPFQDLVSIGYYSLASLLSANRLSPKTGKGCDAPALWSENRLVDLESYCFGDVERLAELVIKPAISIPGLRGIMTPVGTLCCALPALHHMLVSPPKPTTEDQTKLTQLTQLKRRKLATPKPSPLSASARLAAIESAFNHSAM